MSSNTPASSSSTTTTTTTSNGNDSKKQSKSDKDSKILVQFVTKNPAIRVPETPIAVPAKLGRYGLSEVINLLLNNEKPQPFDFLIETEFIRTSIDKHIRKHNLKEVCHCFSFSFSSKFSFHYFIKNMHFTLPYIK